MPGQCQSQSRCGGRVRKAKSVYICFKVVIAWVCKGSLNPHPHYPTLSSQKPGHMCGLCQRLNVSQQMRGKKRNKKLVRENAK